MEKAPGVITGYLLVFTYLAFDHVPIRWNTQPRSADEAWDDWSSAANDPELQVQGFTEVTHDLRQLIPEILDAPVGSPVHRFHCVECGQVDWWTEPPDGSEVYLCEHCLTQLRDDEHPST